MNPIDRDAAPELPGFPGSGPDSGSGPELMADCRRIAARWTVDRPAAPAPVSPAGIHGTRVPAASAHAVAAMPEYGG